MLRPLRPLLALCLGALAAFAVACGGSGDDEKLISQSRADKINNELATIESRVNKGECDSLGPAFTRLDRLVDGLPPKTDRRLRRRLADGVENLRSVSRRDCEDNAPETDTQETTDTTVEPPPETTTQETPTQTTPPPTQTTPPLTATTPPPATTPDDSGGTEAPGNGGDGNGGNGDSDSGKAGQRAVPGNGKAKGKGKEKKR